MAYSGFRPGQYPQSNIFDFVFGNPFQHENEYVPASQKLPLIDNSQPIFIDNKTSKHSPEACFFFFIIEAAGLAED